MSVPIAGPSRASEMCSQKRERSLSSEIESSPPNPLKKHRKSDDSLAVSGSAVADVISSDKKKRRRKKKARKVPVVATEVERTRMKTPAGRDDHRDVSRPSSEVNLTEPSVKAINADSVPHLDTNSKVANEGVKSLGPSPINTLPLQEITSLRTQLSSQERLLNSHTALLANITSSLTCQICLDLMHAPFALAPCGHTACHACLVKWFTAPLPEAAPTLLDFLASNAPNRATNANHPEDQAGPEAVPPHAADVDPEDTFYARRKTCPHCRATITARPVEVWAIKDVVAALTRSGLGPVIDASTSSNVDPNAQVANTRPADPWVNIFSPMIPTGRASPQYDPEVINSTGLYDAEDGGILRCVDCMHEIWDGICTGCDRVYTALFDLEEANMIPDWGRGRPNPNTGFGAYWRLARESNNEDSEDDDSDEDDDDDGGNGRDVHDEDTDEEGYESSFIDDDGGTVVANLLGRTAPGGDADESYDFKEDEHEEDDEDDGEQPPRKRIFRRFKEDTNSGSENASGEVAIISQGQSEVIDLIDDSEIEYVDSQEDSDSENCQDDGSIPGPARRLRNLLADEDDENEEEV